MSKELIALEEMRYLVVFDEDCVDEDGETKPIKVFIDEICEKPYKIVKNALKSLEIIKELFDFDFAIRFGDNQPMIKITNKRNGQYWELPETTEICDLLKEVLL